MEFTFNTSNVDAVLAEVRKAIEEQVGPAHYVFRGVHWVDRRLDYLLAYFLRKHRGSTFTLYGRYADCHRLPVIVVEACSEKHVVPPTREGVLYALAHGQDPRDWQVDASNTRFGATLDAWKQCVWAGNVQEQMKQPISFSWALQSPAAARARPGKRPARQSRTT